MFTLMPPLNSSSPLRWPRPRAGLFYQYFASSLFRLYYSVTSASFRSHSPICHTGPP